MTIHRRQGAFAAFLAIGTMLLAGLAPPAGAVDGSRGYPGFCKDGRGVTVVIDFGKLGGKTLVRCNPRTTRGTGLDALKGAGFQIAGVQRWGESFICRIENRPAANEALPVQGNKGYRESCIDTPPAVAYWSYWHAGNNCAWEYSQWGVKNRDFIPGGFEGWSFALNATRDTSPKPRIAAVRPGTAGGKCNAPDQGTPSTDDPDEKQGNAGVPSAAPTLAETNSADGGNLPAPKPRETAQADEAAAEDAPGDPEDNVPYSGGEHSRDVNEVIQEQSGASDWAPWAAAGAIVLLGLTGWLTVRRRRRALDR